MSKLFLFAAPSGAGKTTIVRHLLNHYEDLSFSISATTRPKRPHETDGKDYYFLAPDTFKTLVKNGGFVEWEEVYEGLFYGTLKREVERLWGEGKHIVFDIDVKGAVNIKQAYPNEAIAIFVKPPSMDALRNRLTARGTEDEANLKKRLDRAEEELSYESRFDIVLVNDNLQEALTAAEQIIEDAIKPA
ncbi:MAG: guanylate kinase [Phaeodactylibacter sp.]|uniref:guanylate kinase n=1 Tax=Phaeodactylibacter sp. TaxID=1940289 RepID=UPI0032EB6960